jgi:hypothetical protein
MDKVAFSKAVEAVAEALAITTELAILEKLHRIVLQIATLNPNRLRIKFLFF